MLRLVYRQNKILAVLRLNKFVMNPVQTGRETVTVFVHASKVHGTKTS